MVNKPSFLRDEPTANQSKYDAIIGSLSSIQKDSSARKIARRLELYDSLKDGSEDIFEDDSIAGLVPDLDKFVDDEVE